jgi:alkylated DNA repair dioxygenase AlkB
VSAEERRAIVAWLARIHPIWEMRYSIRRAPPEGGLQRRLLRPVYWLGSWQFACLDYYRPPNGVANRCVRAEPFPAVLAKMVQRIEASARRTFAPADLPAGWKLNTCLVNLYGARTEDGKKVDSARVGEHKDFEPGPVASVSLGERALFQFVESRRPGERSWPIAQQWLDDGSLQVFGGDYWKRKVFHRVQRVDRRAGTRFSLQVPGFQTRRVNFTFRFVPDAHVTRFGELEPQAREDVRPYVEELAKHSEFFARELAGR